VGEHPLTVDVREGGQVLHLLLDAPKANVLDGRMLAGISAALDRHGESARLKAIVFEGAGVHFSFGASVPEHTRERAGAMLAQLHGLMRRLLALGVPTAAVVRGQCLGGGLELAGFCSWVFASPTAAFGQPEIRLAVYPPFASVLLPWRLGGGRALDLCVSGRSIDAQTALAWGLAHAVVDDPSAACARFLAEEILPKSASSLRRAERAARGELARLVEHALPGLERDYLEDLMETHDANEGIAAFIERRPARWEADRVAEAGEHTEREQTR
jgi:cyclohexa-1,5-dienecarbonyl-CoA hydratase